MSLKYFCLIFMTVVAIWSGFRAQALNSPVHESLIACDPNDLRALQGFMAGLEPVINGWEISSSSNCCHWEGVTCESSLSLGFESFASSVEIGRVVKLELSGKRLFGELSESLGSLDQLRSLNLSHNFLESSLPVSLFNLSNLQALDLSFNDLFGHVPDFINLPCIGYLDMSRNYLNGSLPSRICRGRSRLKALNLAGNFFSGEIPSGFGDCDSLEYLNVCINELTSMSEDIFQLQMVSDFLISDNKFYGQLSSEIGNLTNAIRLDISSNAFSGEIPDVFHRFKKLESFIAHSNNFSGLIPQTLSNSVTLSLLNLRNNSLESPLELNCSAMLSLASLDLGSNRLSKAIPDNIPSCRNLKSINFSRNRFTGQIPESFKNFSSLSYLSLSNTSINNLSLTLKTLQHCNLTTLVLSFNFHDEEMPTNPSLRFENLKTLVIAKCRLRGAMPQWLSKSRDLHLLDLSWNRLNGTIPPWLGSFDFLFYLDLSNNSFIGNIPKSITQLPSLIDGDVSSEEPSPDFPFFKKSEKNATMLQYRKLWSFPPTLDLSSNSLNGPIWPEFGNLKKLHVLSLRLNKLFGQIPSSLSGMRSLETLDLSHNKLSGTIPSSLVTLSFLSKFNVAENELHGEIPKGGQFHSFPVSSFEGNDLCGDQASPCAEIRSHVYPDESTRDTGFVDGLTVGIAFGFVVGAALFQAVSRNYSPFNKLWLHPKLRNQLVQFL